MPAPVPKPQLAAASSSQNVRMATASSAVRRRRRPSRPRRSTGRAGAGSRAVGCAARRLRRAGDRPGREGRGEQLGPAGVARAARRARSRPGAPGRGALDREQARHGDGPGAADAPRSLRTRSTIITFSAASLACRSVARCPVPLIGRDSTRRRRRRRNSSGEATRPRRGTPGCAPRQADDAGVRRRVAGREAPAEPGDVARPGRASAREHAADVRLVDRRPRAMCSRTVSTAAT